MEEVKIDIKRLLKRAARDGALRFDGILELAILIHCGKCDMPPDQYCRTSTGKRGGPHSSRLNKARIMIREAQEVRVEEYERMESLWEKIHGLEQLLGRHIIHHPEKG
jgi:hypothetical protein